MKNDSTKCKTCQLSFERKRAGNVFCCKKCRDKDSYNNNREKAIAAASARLIDPKNRSAHNQAQLKWAHANFEKRKDTMLKYHYGITLSDYEAMYKKQEGKCSICKLPKDVLHVDHCHTTSKIRGLLCGKCNKGLGLFNDNIDLIKEAIEYLNEKT